MARVQRKDPCRVSVGRVYEVYFSLKKRKKITNHALPEIAQKVLSEAFFSPKNSNFLRLTADFAAGVVDVVMENLAGTGAPIDEIAIGGLSIVNGGGDAIFAADSQSTIQFESGGTVVTPIGDPTSFDATGAFFGGDGSGPLEAGGAFQVDGTGGGIFGIFVADDRK